MKIKRWVVYFLGGWTSRTNLFKLWRTTGVYNWWSRSVHNFWRISKLILDGEGDNGDTIVAMAVPLLSLGCVNDVTIEFSPEGRTNKVVERGRVCWYPSRQWHYLAQCEQFACGIRACEAACLGWGDVVRGKENTNHDALDNNNDDVPCSMMMLSLQKIRKQYHQLGSRESPPLDSSTTRLRWS